LKWTDRDDRHQGSLYCVCKVNKINIEFGQAVLIDEFPRVYIYSFTGNRLYFLTFSEDEMDFQGVSCWITCFIVNI
jgi:hypothetical protein